MSVPPRRRRLQLHLSTAIILMFAAGALTWLNISGRRVDSMGAIWYPIGFPMHGDEMTESQFLATKPNRFWHGSRETQHGWPFIAAQRKTEVVVNTEGQTTISKPTQLEWHRSAIIENIAAGLLILLAVWFLCEQFLFSRARTR